MDVLVLIDKLDDLIHNARPVPLTDQVRVDREESDPPPLMHHECVARSSPTNGVTNRLTNGADSNATERNSGLRIVPEAPEQART
jgi:hypothetical protein